MPEGIGYGPGAVFNEGSLSRFLQATPEEQDQIAEELAGELPPPPVNALDMLGGDPAAAQGQGQMPNQGQGLLPGAPAIGQNPGFDELVAQTTMPVPQPVGQTQIPQIPGASGQPMGRDMNAGALMQQGMGFLGQSQQLPEQQQLIQLQPPARVQFSNPYLAQLEGS